MKKLFLLPLLALFACQAQPVYAKPVILSVDATVVCFANKADYESVVGPIVSDMAATQDGNDKLIFHLIRTEDSLDVVDELSTGEYCVSRSIPLVNIIR